MTDYKNLTSHKKIEAANRAAGGYWFDEPYEWGDVFRGPGGTYFTAATGARGDHHFRWITWRVYESGPRAGRIYYISESDSRGDAEQLADLRSKGVLSPAHWEPAEDGRNIRRAAPPLGVFPQGEGTWCPRHFRATGEYRQPRAGEWFLSGAKVGAYEAMNDLGGCYWIAKEI